MEAGGASRETHMNSPSLNFSRGRCIGFLLVVVVAFVAACGTVAIEDRQTTGADAIQRPTPTPQSTAIPAAAPVPSELSSARRSSAAPVSQQRRRSPFVPLDDPEFLSVQEATYLGDENLVLGLDVGGKARAYPVGTVYYHHVVNDTVAGRPILITY